MTSRLIAWLFLAFLLTFSASAQFRASVENESNFSALRKKPVSFSHKPFLLLKMTPTAFIGRDNVFQYGAEIAPSFGKFSFGFDYGKGKGSQSLSKKQRTDHPEQSTRIIRGEIRGYFSDWYPFYSLDKKPFGRYYALEYVHKNLSYSHNAGAFNANNEAILLPVDGVERAVHLKFGKHFIISRWFFIDGFAGLGLGQYSYTGDTIEQELSGFSFTRPDRDGPSKGFFLSKTAGLRLCLPL
jgi:hypothetical protein